MPMIHERSPDTDAVITVLAGVNDEITYGELAKRARLTIKRLKEVLSSARRILIGRDMLFAAIMGVGLKRVDTAGSIGVGEDTKKRIGRAARRGRKKMNIFSGRIHELSPRDQAQFTTTQYILSQIEKSSQAKAPEPPKPKVEEPEMPTVANLLRLQK